MKIFVIVPRAPYPINKGDKLRAYHQIKLLSTKHEIFLFALSDEIVDRNFLNENLPFCKKITICSLSRLQIVANLFKAIFNKLPFQVSYYYSAELKSKIEQEIANLKPDLVFCQLIRTGEYIKDIKGIPTLLDYIDVLSKGLERRLKSANIFLKPLIYLEYKRVLKYEKQMFYRFDKTVIITQNDRELLPFEENTKVSVIPNGIDVDYFKPIDVQKDYDIIFTGNLSYPPNIQAAIILSEKIIPLCLRKYKNLKVLIVGASPSLKVKKLRTENIEIMGWVDDIRNCYARAKIFVAPMQIGTGMQNKLLEAMAMRLPCVTSTLSQQGIQAPVNECLLTGNTPEEFATHICNLLGDENFANKIADNGYRYIKENFNWRTIGDKLEEFVSSVL